MPRLRRQRKGDSAKFFIWYVAHLNSMYNGSDNEFLPGAAFFGDQPSGPSQGVFNQSHLKNVHMMMGIHPFITRCPRLMPQGLNPPSCKAQGSQRRSKIQLLSSLWYILCECGFCSGWLVVSGWIAGHSMIPCVRKWP